MTKKDYYFKNLREEVDLINNNKIDKDVRNLLLLKCRIQMGSPSYQSGSVRSIKKAVIALERDIPMPRLQTRCGKCDLWLNECDWGDEDFSLKEVGGFNYCPLCGQKIDWSKDKLDELRKEWSCKKCVRYAKCSAEKSGLDTEAIDCYLYETL